MDLKHKIMWKMLLGFTLGLIVGIIMFVLCTPDGSIINKTFLVLHLMGSGILGIVGYGGSVVYDFEEWSLDKATFSHYFVTFITMLIISTVLGWFPDNTLFIVLIVFTLVYALIWLIQFLLWKNQIRKMNEDLKELLLNKEKVSEQMPK